MKVKLLKVTQKLIDNYEALLEELPFDRREKTEKIKNNEKYRSLAAGLLLSCCMKEYGLDHKKCTLKYGENGKPYIENSDFHFNLSHSGDYAVIVYGDRECGIDIQCRKAGVNRVANRYFTEKEIEYIAKNEDAFFDIWACKESYLKAIGKGLTKRLDSFECVPVGGVALVGEYKIKVQRFEGYSVAVCLKGEVFDGEIKGVCDADF